MRPGVSGQVALGGHGSRDRVLRPPEGDEEGVPLRVDLPTPVRLEGRAQNPLVLGQHLPVAAGQLLEQLRRALDVGEEEGDGPRRNLPRSWLRRDRSQLGILRENRLLEASQLLSGLEAQLVCQKPLPLPVGLECLRLAP